MPSHIPSFKSLKKTKVQQHTFGNKPGQDDKQCNRKCKKKDAKINQLTGLNWQDSSSRRGFIVNTSACLNDKVNSNLLHSGTKSKTFEDANSNQKRNEVDTGNFTKLQGGSSNSFERSWQKHNTFKSQYKNQSYLVNYILEQERNYTKILQAADESHAHLRSNVSCQPTENMNMAGQQMTFSEMEHVPCQGARPQVTKLDLGCPVIVGGARKGLLRYVGKVIDKEGIFCGIELLVPEGKHNGTFDDVTYFNCPDKHGIFAPLYKVEKIITVTDSKISSSMPIEESENKLIKSAIAALECDEEKLEDIYPNLMSSACTNSSVSSTPKRQIPALLMHPDSVTSHQAIIRAYSSSNETGDLFDIQPPDELYDSLSMSTSESAECSPGPGSLIFFLQHQHSWPQGGYGFLFFPVGQNPLNTCRSTERTSTLSRSN